MDNFDLRKYLAEGRLFEEKKVITNIEDLKSLEDYEDAVTGIRDDAMFDSATDLAKVYGFKSYQDYIDKAHYNYTDDEINHYHYLEEFLPIARENAEINPIELDKSVKGLLRLYDIKFRVDLKKLIAREAIDDFDSWE